jgi:allantoinase
MAQGPARVAGLSRKGRLAAGCDGDLVAFAPERRFVVDPARLHHRHPVTPYAGLELSGVVTGTWLRGRRVDGTQPHGALLTRSSRPEEAREPTSPSDAPRTETKDA